MVAKPATTANEMSEDAEGTEPWNSRQNKRSLFYTPKIKSSKSFELSEASSVVESLNNWATTNSTSSLPYASWKLNADGKPELDLGEMDTW